MQRTILSPNSIALTMLRAARSWSQSDLAVAAATPRNLISDYETSRRTLTREKLAELVALMGYDTEVVDLALALVGFADLVAPAGPEPGPSWIRLSSAERRRARNMAARLAVVVGDLAHSHAQRLLGSRRVDRARRAAATLWKELAGCTMAARRRRLAELSDADAWAVVERLSLESVAVAGKSAQQALQLARLALWLAERTNPGTAWSARLQGFAWAFVGNAVRVGGDLIRADAALATAWRLWRAGVTADAGILAEWRLYDLEADLRRAQRRWQAALGLLDRARVIAPPDAWGRILLNRAALQEQAGEIEAARITLIEAAPLIERTGEPRLRWAWRFNVALNLWHLGRYVDAEPHLDELRSAALDMGNDLDLLRILWLTGRVAAGQGRREEASLALDQVRQEFADRHYAYDAALAALELAALYVQQERHAEVRRLAEETVCIFSAQGAHEEALAALKLFCESARARTATVSQVWRIHAYLELARQDPQLRFDSLL
jgi:tetratricopeptide (TPR) repeat protein/transcriptional regulator with XRE-family HTH domain